MFSTKATALSQIISCHVPSLRISWLICLAALCLILAPPAVLAQTSQNGDDPPPIWYRPDPDSADRNALRTFLCRSTSADLSGDVFCAGEIGLSESAPVNLTAEPTMFTFVLDTHETLSLTTEGSLDTHGQLLDVSGARVAADDDGGDDRNFQIIRTLGPGRYYLKVTGDAGPSTVRVARTRPQGWNAGGSPADLTRDVGNHCGRAARISTTSRTASIFDRPGDIDVYAVRIEQENELLIDVDGGARYELKAADCSTSLGIASSRLGSTVASLDEGTYFLYVSRSEGAANDYELRLEPR